MTSVDEALSAFLDGELSPEEMQKIRNRLAVEPALAARLSELALVDQTLQTHYSAIDGRPLPEAVTQLLATTHDEPERPNNVIRFPLWQRLQAHTGKAIAAALVAGFALAQWLSPPPTGTDAAWHSVAQGLETTPSGVNYTLASGEQLMPRLTFVNHEGEYCRQFRLQGHARSSENIACRSAADNDGWSLAVRVEVADTVPADRYQVASGGSVLDDTLDQMISGPLLTPDAEQRLIQQNWAAQP
ncbi:MAG: hypothetical protein KBT82_16790 [Marinobacter sp.]|uniref:anti-sigma factor family protein n=1 Tax=Marinobacter sp. TaxID=50741 RepID=UPI001B78653C|nr:zf-HC2 domain-containing protein [Marinobacter sp.]MBQ0746811.1 hypothetical protein [Marinobacter sp.]MBQ0815803.1 hypothetical protein [Marinobacter sp.]|tara:strand:+ start:279 stop:1010 length:732 start_codon:yes stop_codon:yes gene_type:complete